MRNPFIFGWMDVDFVYGIEYVIMGERRND